jgi:hypothetical protein
MSFKTLRIGGVGKIFGGLGKISPGRLATGATIYSRSEIALRNVRDSASTEYGF